MFVGGGRSMTKPLRGLAIASCRSAAMLFALSASASAQEWIATVRGHADFDGFGHALDVVDDVDSDGVDDLLIGSPFATDVDSHDGAVELVSGATGATLQIWRGTGRDAQLGLAVAALGDIDGDGTSELLMGMPNYAGSAVTGEAWIASGATGAVLRIHVGAAMGGAFGAEVAALADLNRDGVREFAVGAPGASTYFVYDGASGNELHFYTSVQADSGLGWAIEPLDDLSGDGVPDVLVTAPFWKNSSGITTGRTTLRSGVDGSSFWSHVGENTSAFAVDFYGMTAAALDDLDGDGVGDYAIGAWAFGNCQEGRVYVHSGATGAELSRLNGSACGECLGIALANGGDLNADGVGDLLIGLPHRGSNMNGGVRLVSGADARDLSLVDGAAGERLGCALGPAHDLDHDGIVDLLLTAIGPVDAYTGSVQRYECVPPTTTTLSPDRGNYKVTTNVTLTGAAFRSEAAFEIEVDGTVIEAVQLPSTTTCTFDFPIGRAGPTTITLRNSFGSTEAVFQRTPTTSVEGDFSPGGSGVWTTLVDPCDGIVLIAGLPPSVAIPTPPYDGELAILSFTIVWVESRAASDRFDLAFEIDDEPSLSGLDLLVQALAGPKLGGRKKDGSWSNGFEFEIR